MRASIILPQASFLGHASGIFSGLLVCCVPTLLLIGTCFMTVMGLASSASSLGVSGAGQRELPPGQLPGACQRHLGQGSGVLPYLTGHCQCHSCCLDDADGQQVIDMQCICLHACTHARVHAHCTDSSSKLLT